MSDIIIKTPAEKALEFHKGLKDQVRSIINDNTNKASELAVNAADPHTPVIQAMQIALINASIDYMIVCGATPQDAVNDVIGSLDVAVRTWINAVQRMGKEGVKPN